MPLYLGVIPGRKNPDGGVDPIKNSEHVELRAPIQNETPKFFSKQLLCDRGVRQDPRVRRLGRRPTIYTAATKLHLAAQIALNEMSSRTF